MRRIILLLFVLLLSAWAHGQQNIAFVQDGASSPWFQTPIGPNSFYVSSTQKTWFCWEGWQTISGTPQRVVEFTTWHPQNGWTANTVAGTRSLTGDVHGVPACLRDSAGYIYAFYGDHNSGLKIANSTNPDDPTAWTDTQVLNGTYTFPNPYLVGNSIYLFTSGPGAGTGVQESVTVQIATFSNGTLSFGSRKTLFDSAGAAQNGWLPLGAFAVVGTKIHMVFDYGTSVGIVPSNIYYAIYDTTNGTVCNYSGGTCVAAASQPIGLTSLNANFKIYTCGPCGFPSLAIDGDGRSHVVVGEGAGPQVQTHISAIGGGSWSATHTVFSYQYAMDPFDLLAGPVVNAANGVDIYFGDGLAGYTFPGTDRAAAGNIYKNTRANDGTWSGPVLVRAMQPGRYGMDEPQPTFNASSDVRVIFTEVSPDYSAVVGTLRGFALGDNGYIVRP